MSSRTTPKPRWLPPIYFTCAVAALSIAANSTGKTSRTFDPKEFVPSLLKQLYLDAAYLPKAIHVPVDFEDRALLEETLTERSGHKVEIFTPQRGSKRAFLDLVENNAKHAFEQRFRVLKPTSKMIGEAVQNALNLLEEPRRIESFDISHMQGTDTVASMVVWENGRMKKSDYRKFIIRGEFAGNGALDGDPSVPWTQNDDFASMKEAVTRRYRRVLEEKKPLPSLILIDGGIGQLHAAADALESLQIINQPLAASPRRKKFSTSTDRKTNPAYSTAIRPSCISSSRFATRPTASP